MLILQLTDRLDATKWSLQAQKTLLYQLLGQDRIHSIQGSSS